MTTSIDPVLLMVAGVWVIVAVAAVVLLVGLCRAAAVDARARRAAWLEDMEEQASLAPEWRWPSRP